MKKKLLFALPSMRSGGAEKSLVSLLQSLDYDRFEVDLFLFREEGLFLPLIPPEVNIYKADDDYLAFDGSAKKGVLYFLKQGRPDLALDRIRYGKAQRLPERERVEKSWSYLTKVLPDLPDAYDAAIGYLEGTSTYFVLDHVNAKKYFSFLHTDYDRIRAQKAMDTKYYGKLDVLFGVSDLCCERARRYFPVLEDRTVTMQNIISQKLIRQMAQEQVELPKKGDSTTIITVGRMAPPKGIDLAVKACGELVRRGRNIKWYHIGVGELQSEIEAEIAQQNVQNSFILLGEQSNPYAFVKQCDVYVQPSRFEGKSIAVDEAKCLGMPIVATNFGTVHDQIQDGVNGLIVEKDPVAIADGVERLMDNETLRNSLMDYLEFEKIDNVEEVEVLYECL